MYYEIEYSTFYYIFHKFQNRWLPFLLFPTFFSLLSSLLTIEKVFTISLFFFIYQCLSIFFSCDWRLPFSFTTLSLLTTLNTNRKIFYHYHIAQIYHDTWPESQWRSQFLLIFIDLCCVTRILGYQ